MGRVVAIPGKLCDATPALDFPFRSTPMRVQGAAMYERTGTTLSSGRTRRNRGEKQFFAHWRASCWRAIDFGAGGADLLLRQRDSGSKCWLGDLPPTHPLRSRRKRSNSRPSVRRSRAGRAYEDRGRRAFRRARRHERWAAARVTSMSSAAFTRRPAVVNRSPISLASSVRSFGWRPRWRSSNAHREF
jgi:hypothetical protein